MEWYFIIKTIHGRRYRYRQKTWRNGTRVRTHSQYIGPETLVGYHGTFAKFEKFDAEHLGSNTNCDSACEGFFFASNKKVAISYVSTHLAKQRSLQSKIHLLEHRIEALTGYSVYWVDEHVSELDDDKANKLKTYLGMIARARRRLHDCEITTVVQSKRGDVKRCVLDIKKPYVHDMAGRHYDEGEYYDAACCAKEEGCDGLIIKNTYDPGSWVPIKGNSLTDIYVAFDSGQIRPM